MGTSLTSRELNVELLELYAVRVTRTALIGVGGKSPTYPINQRGHLIYYLMQLH